MLQSLGGYVRKGGGTTVNKIAPKETFTTVRLASDTGISATDHTTSNGAVTFSGVVSDFGGPGVSSVKVYNGTTLLGRAIVFRGVWTLSTTLAEGTYSALTVVATDRAGISSTIANSTVLVIDKTPPALSITSQILASDSGVSATDLITSNGTVTLTGTATGSTGSVQVFDGTTLLGTAVADGTGQWSFATTLKGDGAHALHAVATDAAGNVATTAAQPAITLDTTPPLVAITAQKLASDTGSSGTDLITSNGAVTLSGTSSGGTGSVQIYDGTMLIGTAAVDAAGHWSFMTTLGAGAHALHAATADAAGNAATTAAQPVITVDTTPPLLVITSQTLAADTGNSATDLLTNNGLVTLTGTAGGARGNVQIYDGTTALGLAAIDTTGHWSFTTTLKDGSHALHAAAVDQAGNMATTAAEPVITVDTTKPAVGFAFENQVVGSNSVQMWGSYSGPAGTTVEVYSGTTDLGAATLLGNAWYFNTAQLSAGNYSFSAVATTAAGNTATFGGIPSLTVGGAKGTLNLANYSTVWQQDFTHATQVDRTIFPIVYGNANQFSFGADGLTLTSYKADGFQPVGILQANWGANLGEGYGLYSVTASHPANQGAGIAILLWPSNNVWPGPEMDMVEDWSDPTSQTAYMSVHFKGPNGENMGNTIKFTVDLTKPATYSMDWEQGSLTYYINGQEVFQITGSEVPLDFAHGGVNASFGAQITDTGASAQPSDRVSLTIASMSYSAALHPAVAAGVHGTLLSPPVSSVPLDVLGLGTAGNGGGKTYGGSGAASGGVADLQNQIGNFGPGLPGFFATDPAQGGQTGGVLGGLLAAGGSKSWHW